jgi:hypothetical protein
MASSEPPKPPSLPDPKDWALVKYVPAPGFDKSNELHRLDIFTGQMVLNWAKTTRNFLNLYKAFHKQSQTGKTKAYETALQHVYEAMLDSYVRFLVAQEAHGSILPLTRTSPNMLSQTVEEESGFFGKTTTEVNYPITDKVLQEINEIISMHEDPQTIGFGSAAAGGGGYEIRPIATLRYGLNAMTPRAVGGGEEPIVHRAIMERYLNSTGILDNLFVEPIPIGTTWNTFYQNTLRKIKLPVDKRFLNDDALDELRNLNSPRRLFPSAVSVLLYAEGLVGKNLSEEEKKKQEEKKKLTAKVMAGRLGKAAVQETKETVSSTASSALNLISRGASSILGITSKGLSFVPGGTKVVGAASSASSFIGGLISNTSQKVKSTYSKLETIAKTNTKANTNANEKENKSKNKEIVNAETAANKIADVSATIANKEAIELILNKSTINSSFTGNSTDSSKPFNGLSNLINSKLERIDEEQIEKFSEELDNYPLSQEGTSGSSGTGLGSSAAGIQAVSQEQAYLPAGTKRGRSNIRNYLQQNAPAFPAQPSSRPFFASTVPLAIAQGASTYTPRTPPFPVPSSPPYNPYNTSRQFSQANLNNSGPKTPPVGEGGRRKLRKTNKKHRKNKRKTYRRKH